MIFFYQRDKMFVLAIVSEFTSTTPKVTSSAERHSDLRLRKMLQRLWAPLQSSTSKLFIVLGRICDLGLLDAVIQPVEILVIERDKERVLLNLLGVRVERNLHSGYGLLYPIVSYLIVSYLIDCNLILP